MPGGSAGEGQGGAAHHALGIDIPLLVVQKCALGGPDGRQQRVKRRGAAPPQRIAVLAARSAQKAAVVRRRSGTGSARGPAPRPRPWARRPRGRDTVAVAAADVRHVHARDPDQPLGLAPPRSRAELRARAGRPSSSSGRPPPYVARANGPQRTGPRGRRDRRDAGGTGPGTRSNARRRGSSPRANRGPAASASVRHQRAVDRRLAQRRAERLPGEAEALRLSVVRSAEDDEGPVARAAAQRGVGRAVGAPAAFGADVRGRDRHHRRPVSAGRLRRLLEVSGEQGPQLVRVARIGRARVLRRAPVSAANARWRWSRASTRRRRSPGSPRG